MNAPSRSHLYLLDSILVLVVLLYLNNGPTVLAASRTILVVAVCTTLSWMVWRRSEHSLAALAVACSAFALYSTANNPISVIALWCAIVALRLSTGTWVAYCYAGLIVAANFAAQVSVHQVPARIIAETVTATVVGVVGINLANTIVRQRGYEQELQEMAFVRERQRIAASLHDGLGHRLTTIGMSLDYAQRVRDPDKARAEIARARADVSAALDEMRATVRAMKPTFSPDEGIEASLAQLAESFATTSLDVRFTRGQPAKFTNEESLLLLHFVQESLTNVLRHADASRVDIHLDARTLSVADNGTGNTAPESYGISSLRERARALGGTVATDAHGGIDGGFQIALHLKEKRWPPLPF